MGNFSNTFLITSEVIVDTTIKEEDLADNCVTSAKIKNNEIVNADIKNTAGIEESKLAFNTVAGHDHDGVDSKQIQHATLPDVTTPHVEADIEDNAITSAKIKDGEIVNADLNATANVDRSKMNESQDLNIKTGKKLIIYDTANTKKLELYRDVNALFLNTDAGAMVLAPANGVINLYKAGTSCTLYLIAPDYSGSLNLSQDTANGTIATSKGNLRLNPTGHIDCLANEVKNVSKFGYNSAKTGYLSIPPSAFMPYDDTYNWVLAGGLLKNRTALTTQSFYAPVILPHGAVVTTLHLYYYRDDGASSLVLYLFGDNLYGTSPTTMATVTATGTAGDGTDSDSTITSPTIDNSSKQYYLKIEINPNDSVEDCKLAKVTVVYTATEVLT